VQLRKQPGTPFGNQILNALPREEHARLSPYMEVVKLPTGKTLYETGDAVRQVYFPMGGMASLISATEGGAAVEVGMVGDEGMVGLPAVLGTNVIAYRVVMQVPGNAFRIPAGAVRSEFDRGGRLHDLLLRYTATLLTQVSQSAACNRFHSMRARLCRWLLVSHDRSRSDTLTFTQEFLSFMIGAPRSRVTTAAGSLQDAGLIRYRRGRIEILDRAGLEASSCECYRIINEQLKHFMAA
jgi:CRP-like cAMP-binding protein